MADFRDVSSFLNSTRKEVLNQISNVSFFNTQNIRALERDAQSRISKGARVIKKGVENRARGFEQQGRLTILGGDIQAVGFGQQAAGFRRASEQQGQATAFNLGIDSLNTKRRLKSAKSQMDRLLGQQLVQTASSGISLSSKSALAARAATSNAFSESIRDIQTDASNVRKAKLFQSQIQRTELENRARASDFQAKTANLSAELQAIGSLQRASALRVAGKAQIANLKSLSKPSRSLTAAKQLQSRITDAKSNIKSSKRRNPFGVSTGRRK